MKKGFTLIELLGTIVILGLIALIATPPIVNLVKKSDNTISTNNMKLIYQAGEDYLAEFENNYTLTTGKKICLSIETLVDNGNLKESFIKQQNIDTKKYIQYTVGDKMKLQYELKLYDTDIDCAKINKIFTIGEVVYFDPTGAVADCASGKEWTPTRTGTTCYKWNVVKDNGISIEMLLDHNTTAKIAWNLSGSTANGPLEVYNQLKTDTNNWSKVETLTSSDNVTRTNGSNGTYIINYNGMKARLISGQEVADIGGDSAWAPSNSTGTVYSNQSWLYQNLSDSNTATQPYGYWTDTAHPSNSVFAWHVPCHGVLYSGSARNANTIGVRPAVRVLKSNI